MSNIYIYLAGPISGCTYGEANDWRDEVSRDLRDVAAHIRGVSPLRCEPLHGERYKPEYADARFGTPSAIAAKNKEDVRRCDAVLAYLPADEPASVGTLQEIGWAAGLGKPIVLVTDNGRVRNNPVIKATVPWRFLETPCGFQEAIDTLTGIFGVYE